MKAKQTATNLLKQQEISNFAVDVFNLKHDITIHIDSFLTYGELTGYPCAFNTDSYAIRHIADKISYVVLYNDFAPRRRRRWNVAHELGHIYLGHEDDGRENEIEAHAFASHLLMPDIVVKELIRLGYREYIASIFDVSDEAAWKKLKYMERMPPLRMTDEFLLKKYEPLFVALEEKNGKSYCNRRVLGRREG